VSLTPLILYDMFSYLSSARLNDKWKQNNGSNARESVLEELHGIRNDNNPEDPESVAVWLQILDMHINTIKRGTVYEIAEAMNRSHVTSRGFRMTFLRANRYDPCAAATHIIQFLELKRSLFGQEKLVKKITLDDLEEEDVQNIEAGSCQISSQTDRSGRKIILFFPSLQYEATAKSLVKARYYVVMSLLESEETQINGVIFVYFGVVPTKKSIHSSNPGVLWKVPLHFAGLHLCLSDLAEFLLLKVAIYRLPLNLRPRVRVHYGSSIECQYKLSSFGIPREALQMPATNEPTTVDVHFAWYRHRQQLELPSHSAGVVEFSRSTPSTTIVPGTKDVLFGGGQRTNSGNVRLQKLVISMIDEHKASSKGKKMQITDIVIKEIKKGDGRFLKQNDVTKEWEEASHTEVNRKIAHAFRNIRRPSRANKRSEH
jgi:hypothetical protein